LHSFASKRKGRLRAACYRFFGQIVYMFKP
jgi:hypothetical protein